MAGVDFAYQTELQQASELVKRFAYSFSMGGIDRIFWSRIMDQRGWGGNAQSFFNTVGLINNAGGKGKASKKLSYYTYKMLIDKLDRSDLNNIKTIDLGDDVFAFRFMKNNRPVYVMWLK